jgi:hypothetical protein
LVTIAAVLAVSGAHAQVGAAIHVDAGRSYVGTVRRSAQNRIDGGSGDSISANVSARGTTVTVIAVYNNCPVLGISYPELAFPAARIVDGRFKTTFTKQETVGDLYADITVIGRFLSQGRVKGTISSITNVSYRSLRLPGAVCRTVNAWKASAQPRGFHVCVPHPLGIFGVAQDITDDHVSCAVVQGALAHGRFDPPPPPLASDATFSTPGWECQISRTRSRAWRCTRADQKFEFVVAS